jgi:cytochrome c oxidase subunit 3
MQASISDRRPALDPGALALWVFLSTVVMLFAAFASAYLIRRTAVDWAPVALPAVLWVNTGVLVASSVVLEMAERARRRQERRGASWVGLALLLSLLFLIGQGAAWLELARRGILVWTGPYSSFLYILSGLHGIHLLGGILFLSATLWALIRRDSAQARRRLKLCATYWHFLGGLWIFLFLLLLGG